ncbi:MAG: methyltransferase domain-containing protein [Bacteroidota bacterium]
MTDTAFDEFAEKYDFWFLQNRTVLQSEILLLKHALSDPGKTLSVGCGSGLFEQLLRSEHGVDIRYGVEPADAMARIAEKRGMSVKRGAAEELPYGDSEFDTVLLNGIPSYVADLEKAFLEAFRVLRPGGHVVVLDVPAESSYGLLYRLASLVGSYDDDYLKRVVPELPYPMEFARAANWRTTAQKAEMLHSAGYVELEFAQTLTRHPKFSNDSVETPQEGFDRGDYVSIRARKP